MKLFIFANFVLVSILIVSCKERSATEEAAGQAADTLDEIQGAPEGLAEYIIDSSASIVRWKGFKPTGVHNGIVPVRSGKISLSDGKITGGMVEMDMTRITVLDLEGEDKRKLEAHLRGTDPGKEQDFFNVDQYPKSIFQINSVSRLENDPDATHMINGALTIKDINKPVSFKAAINITGDKLTATTPEFNIDRTEFDIKFMSRKFFRDLQDNFVNDEFALQIELVAMRKG